MRYDQTSFILGMVTAFCECVAGGCKRMALSPPMTDAAWEAAGEAAQALVEKHGLLHYHETNGDLPPEERFHWLVIAARPDTLAEYRRLRGEGYSPAKWMKPFHELLSYNDRECVSTGYDAYKEFFDGDQNTPGL